MNENLKIFLQKVAADESLQAKMQSFTDIDEAYEFAMSIQGGFTKEEFTEIMSKISEKIDNNDELTDEDLVGIAGGGNSGVALSVTASLSVAGAVSAAAA